MKRVALLIILSQMLCITSVTANPSEKPQTEMHKLSALAGNWSMLVEMTQDGQNWEASPEQQVTLSFMHNQMVLAEKPQASPQAQFSMLTFITYDQYRKVYRKAAIDDVWGIMDMYEGDIAGSHLVMDNLKSETFFPVGDKVWRGFRLTVDLEVQVEGHTRQRAVKIDKTDDQGQSWQPAFRVTYRQPVDN